MNVPHLNDTVTASKALAALREYKAHRDKYDARDLEIERIYRAISKGKLVISVADAIRSAGLNEQSRPKLAIARADCERVRLSWPYQGHIEFHDFNLGDRRWKFRLGDFPGVKGSASTFVPRIPPQHRPVASKLKQYWILFEADWKSIPRDPYLLKRIGADAWLVLAAWDLTDVELSVLRAHGERTANA